MKPHTDAASAGEHSDGQLALAIGLRAIAAPNQRPTRAVLGSSADRLLSRQEPRARRALEQQMKPAA